MTERLPFHFSLSCIGEGNGNPLQCSCLENPGDGGAWWAAVYGVAKSRTLLSDLAAAAATVCMHAALLSHGQLSATPRAAARLAPLSMGFSRQEYWSEVSRPPHSTV